MRPVSILFVLILCLHVVYTQAQNTARQKTCFQTADGWREDWDVRSDVSIVYGISSSFNDRVKSWREHGYHIHFMTGIAWGEYQDYFTGKWDGKTHWDEGQTDKDGNIIWHGKDVPYVVPSASYLAYIKSLVKQAIDAGATAIHLEEPEFWSRSGYSASFKKEWQLYYGFPWRPQHESPEATWLSSKLKYHLYFNALKEVFRYAKEYSAKLGKPVKCYVPTHSLLNYSAWQIVSPEASLAGLPEVDGYIAQVWTGTSREPNYFNGIQKERVFENALLEYGSMVSMTAPTNRKIFFLTDPIEDARRSWDDYKKNYQATFTAQLMYPMVADYEVMPWPTRIYTGKFKIENSDTLQTISKAYATQMQIMINSLNDMPLSPNRLNGSKGIAVLAGNSMMFQRFPTHKGYEDPRLSNFYGMILPLIKRGIPAEIVHMENLGVAATLQHIKVLIMSYANMKPLSPDVHTHIANWVKKGGVLIYYGRDNDPFQEVREWWNTENNRYPSASAHLFQQLGIQPANNPEKFSVGKGTVYIQRQDPKELVLQPRQDTSFIALVKQAYETAIKTGQKTLITKNNFYLQRGPYDIAAVMDESVNGEPLHIKGPVIDLFDPELPVLPEKIVYPAQQAYLYNLNRSTGTKPRVLCAAARVYEEQRTGNSYSFVAKSPSHTWNVMRLWLPKAPVQTVITLANGQVVSNTQTTWDAATHTCLLQFENDCRGIKVQLRW